MKKPKNVKELYGTLTKYLTYRHLIHKYHDDKTVLAIVEVSAKGYAKSILRSRTFYNGRGFILSYDKASAKQDVWRMYINERSA